MFKNFEKKRSISFILISNIMIDIIFLKQNTFQPIKYFHGFSHILKHLLLIGIS